MKIADKILTIAEMLSLTPADRFALGTDGFRTAKKVTDTREAFKKVTPQLGKLMAALKVDHARFLDTKAIRADMSFREFYALNCGGPKHELPAGFGKLESLGGLFNSLCMVLDGNGEPLLPEPHYDAASANALETANKIINDVIEANGDQWRTCPTTLDVLKAFKMGFDTKTQGVATAMLKAIRESQKGEKPEEPTAENAVVLTPEGAVQFLKDWIKTAGTQPEEKSSAIFAGTQELVSAWETSGVTEETLNKWADNLNTGTAPGITVLKTETPAPAEEKPEAVAA